LNPPVGENETRSGALACDVLFGFSTEKGEFVVLARALSFRRAPADSVSSGQ
jgi:hypothetical protein